MAPDQLAAFAGFAAIMSLTPGPNNTMVLASGLNHGFRRSLPHLAGIALGFSLMVLLTGLGLHAVFDRLPALAVAMKYAGAAYLLWMAWALASAPAPGPAGARRPGTSAQPMRLLAAAAFQWVNPKAWVMAIGAVTTYLQTPARTLDVLWLALMFGAINAPCVAVWAGLGTAMRRLLHSPRALRAVNIGLAVLLVLSLVPVLKA